MKLKSLAIAAATLAVGAITSQAQVYSQNIVGYINVATVAGQYVLLGNQLDNGTNKLNDLVPTAPTGSTALIWNGASYTGSTKSPVGWNPNSSVPVGTGFFIRTSAVITNTFAGNVAGISGGTVTNVLPGAVYSLVSSGIPFSENLGGTNINLSPATGSTALIWNGASYNGSTKSPVGWNPNPVINVGQGFFVRPAATYTWIQKSP